MKKRIILLILLLLTLSTSLHAEGEEEGFIGDEETELALSEEWEEFDVAAFEEIEEEKLIAAAANIGPNAAGSGAEGGAGPQDEDFVDPRVLRDFIESKGLINCRQKEGTLTIAGDVRARWMDTYEEVNGVRQRGDGTFFEMNTFKSEVNLFLDYVAPRAWISTKLRWSVFDGVDGGTATKTDLERAFIGFDIYNQKEEDFYIELGRSKLDYLYESKVQFSSFYDGIHIFYTCCWPTVGTFTIHGGPFIVDSYSNHYAWVIETFITRWRGTGFGFKYSFIDWHRGAPTLNYGNRDNPAPPQTVTIRNNPRYRFMVSQMLIGYERKMDFLGCKTFYGYGAVLVNHDAQRTQTTNWKKLNGAWYVGFTLGKLCKACDWSLDINYQSVQAQAVPEFDLAGFGHGDVLGNLLSDAILLGLAPGNARGFTNYKGWQLNFLYALTDSLSLRAKAEWSTPRNKSVGGRFFYKNFEMAVIFAF